MIHTNVNDVNRQCRRYKNSFSMNVFGIAKVATMQRCKRCSFDSPGLARNEPTLGERSQGDSTPSVLSFL